MFLLELVPESIFCQHPIVNDPEFQGFKHKMDMVDITTTFLESQKIPLDVVDSLIPRIIDINQKTYKFIALSQSSILSNFKQLSDLGKKIEGLKLETRDIRLESKTRVRAMIKKFQK